MESLYRVTAFLNGIYKMKGTDTDYLLFEQIKNFVEAIRSTFESTRRPTHTARMTDLEEDSVDKKRKKIIEHMHRRFEEVHRSTVQNQKDGLGIQWLNFFYLHTRFAYLIKQRPASFKAFPGVQFAGMDRNLTTSDILWIRVVWQPDVFITYESKGHAKEEKKFKRSCAEINDACQSNGLKCAVTPCRYEKLFIDDYKTPSVDVLTRMWDLSRSGRLVMRCSAGWGRTGFMLGSLL